MSKCLLYSQPIQIGTLVYKPYEPASCGKVVETRGFDRYADGSKSDAELVVIKWLKDGTRSIQSTLHLNDFGALVEEHKRKYEKHSATLEKLKAL